MTATRALWLALYAATHDRYPHLAVQCLAARDALPATADALGGPVSPDSADMTPSGHMPNPYRQTRTEETR